MIRTKMFQRIRRPSGPRFQGGASLLEVMISVLILGIGMLGIAAMQATALRNSQGSLERSQAVIQSYAILDSMRANRASAIAGDYNLAAMTCVAPASGASLAASDLHIWLTTLRDPRVGVGESACGQIQCAGANGDCTVTVQWDEGRATDAVSDEAVGAGQATRSFVTGTRI